MEWVDDILFVYHFSYMFKTKNNVQIPIKTTISWSATTAVLEDGYWALIDSSVSVSNPTRWTLEKFDSQGRVIKREIVDITWKSWDIIDISRAVESCPFSWDALSHTSTQASFDQWDVLTVSVTSWMLDDFQNRIKDVEDNKLNISDYQNGTKVYQASSSGNDSYAITLSPAPSSYQVGMTFKFMADVANTGPATLNVNWLGAKTILKQHDVALWDWDIESGQIITVSYDGTNFQMDSQVATIPSVNVTWLTENTSVNIAKTVFLAYNEISWNNEKIRGTNLLSVQFWDWSDWDVTISTSVTLVRDMYYNNLTIASGWILNPNWYRIYCTWTFTIASGWILRRNWNNWTDWAYNAQWIGWAALNAWSINWETWAAWNGGTWSIAWSPWISANPSYQSNPWANWGTAAYAWWVWWTSTQWYQYNWFYDPKNFIFLNLFPWIPFAFSNSSYKSSWTAWGGCWSQTWSSNYRWWGGGGGNGWCMAIFARVFINQWTIEAKWGNGGLAWGSTWGWYAWGGGGGNGWTLITVTKSYTSTWTINLAWWSGGWANWGTAWANWYTWLHINIWI